MLSTAAANTVGCTNDQKYNIVVAPGDAATSICDKGGLTAANGCGTTSRCARSDTNLMNRMIVTDASDRLVADPACAVVPPWGKVFGAVMRIDGPVAAEMDKLADRDLEVSSSVMLREGGAAKG